MLALTSAALIDYVRSRRAKGAGPATDSVLLPTIPCPHTVLLLLVDRVRRRIYRLNLQFRRASNGSA